MYYRLWWGNVDVIMSKLLLEISTIILKRSYENFPFSENLKPFWKISKI